MITIQDVGKDILNHSPKKFYVFVGPEYGIKLRYIKELENYYGDIEYPENVSIVLNSMKSRHIIPLNPKVYVIRYDEDFVSSLNDNSQSMINRLNIIGTIVCIYEQPKHVARLDKYLPDFTVSIDNVNPQYLYKYLKTDFPNLDDIYINLAIKISSDYNQAGNICRCMLSLDDITLRSIKLSNLEKLFGYTNVSSEIQLKASINHKDFAAANRILSDYEGDPDSILYSVLSTLIDLDKAFSSKYLSEDVRKYIKLWTPEDVYNLFCYTYLELKRLRSLSYSDGFNSVNYILGMLTFDRIPQIGAMV